MYALFTLALALSALEFASAGQIWFGGDRSACLTAQARHLYDGARVIVNNCSDSLKDYQDWNINRGSGQVSLAINNKFCLDAGSNPGNGVGMKIWTCYDNLPAQTWWYTDDDRIALEGQGLCLDLPSGSTEPYTWTQTWECGDGNNNQVWRSA